MVKDSNPVLHSNYRGIDIPVPGGLINARVVLTQ